MAAPAPGGWPGRALAAGLLGAPITSSCCLPMAVAIALGLSLGTIATLEQLLAYQHLFQAAGMAFAGFAAWWALGRCRVTCSRQGQARRASLDVVGAVLVGCAVLMTAHRRAAEVAADQAGRVSAWASPPA